MSMIAFLFVGEITELSLAGEWTVERAVSSCSVSRSATENAAQWRVSFRTVPHNGKMELLLSRPSRERRQTEGNANVVLGGGTIPEFAEYSSVYANGLRETTISLPSETLDALAKGESISIRADKVKALIRPTEFDEALKILAQCESELLASWGFSKAEQESISVPLKGSLRGLIQASDYPPDLLRMGIGGTVGFRMRIDSDGTVGECAVLESSGIAFLDQHTCALIKQRARFSPSVRHDGTPMRSFTYGKIRWRSVRR